MNKEISEKVYPDGYFEIRVRENDKQSWKLIDILPNLLPDVSLAQMALLHGDGTAIAFSHGAIGEGTTAPAVGDTVLEDEKDRQEASFSRETTTVTNDTSKWITTHTAPGGGWSITEYGLLNAASGGTLMTRITFSAIALAEGNQIEFTYKNQVKRSA